VKGGENVTEQQLRNLGAMADQADSYLALVDAPMPDSLRVDAMKAGLRELSEELKALYVELAGENPWQD